MVLGSDQWHFARAFELVAIATIEDAVRMESMQHAPGAPERQGERSNLIKDYLQRFRLPASYSHVYNDEHWFKALDRLLECISNTPSDQSFLVTRDEAMVLADLYMVPRITHAWKGWVPSTLYRLSSRGHPCTHLKEYLVKHSVFLNLTRKERSSSMDSNSHWLFYLN